MIRKSCDECNGKLIEKDVDYKLFGVNLGRFPAEVCTKCGEQVFTEEVTEQILLQAKKKGLYGLHSHTKVGISGNSFDIKISKKISDFLKLKKGQEVQVYPESKRKLVVLL